MLINIKEKSKRVNTTTETRGECLMNNTIIDNTSVFETIANDIYNSDMSETDKQTMMKNLLQLKEQEINILKLMDLIIDHIPRIRRPLCA